MLGPFFQTTVYGSMLFCFPCFYTVGWASRKISNL